MQLGMIGLGRMGANMARRAMRAGLELVVHDVDPEAVRRVVDDGAVGAASLDELVERLRPPRAVWIMLPVTLVDDVIAELAPRLARGDVLIDGGNSHFPDDIRRARELSVRGLHYLDVGTSGGVWGLERGYCLMIGGEPDIVTRLEPVFEALAPGVEAAPRTPERAERGPAAGAERGWLHCGAHGAGHFVKMVHNGIEYGVMAAYAEGFNLLRHADFGARLEESEADRSPARHPEHYRYELELDAIAEVWRRGSVIGSWLLDLTASALAEDPRLERYSGHVSDSGEGRWTVQAAVDAGVPAHVLTAALYERFASRDHGAFAGQVLSAMRFRFGGHAERSGD